MNNMLTLTKKNPVCVRVTQTGLYEVPNMNDFVSDHNLVMAGLLTRPNYRAFPVSTPVAKIR